jgi:D-glycero-D-manno-heptose 1,7-bisphosphate phosphatase
MSGIEIREYKLVLFDRDGTLTQPASGEKFPKSVNDQQWIDGRLERLHQLQEQGVHTAIITNQGGAAWGIFEPDAMCEMLSKQCKEGKIDTFFVCFHDTGQKAKASPKTIRELTGDEAYQGYAALYKDFYRRKPGPGMLIEAMDHFGIDRHDTLMVGDREEDRLAAEAAGVSFEWEWQFFDGDKPIIV